MNREEAKEILLPYRHGTDDANDPQIAEALALAKLDPELGRWLEEHCARQYVLREKFRQMAVPDGLMEQIISEHAAANRAGWLKKNQKLVVLMAAMVIFLVVAYRWQQQPGDDAGLAEYQNQMTVSVSMNYAVGLATNDLTGIRGYLKQKDAPADFALTGPLKQAVLTGCAVETWQDKKASLICFHTGNTSTNAATSDLWLFVVDRNLVKDAPAGATPQLAQIHKFVTATWTEGGKLYLLASEGSTADLKKFL